MYENCGGGVEVMLQGVDMYASPDGGTTNQEFGPGCSVMKDGGFISESAAMGGSMWL